jgi:hypothetical protein
MRSRGHDLYRMETGRCLTVSVIQFRICLYFSKNLLALPTFRKISGQLAQLRNSSQRGVNASLEGELIIGSMDHPLPHGKPG